ncbi:MAG: type II toxin-antitoxin system HicB family antitoxin [Planctomycetota bacterium]
MKVPVNLFQDEDDMWIAEVVSIPGCVTQGKTKVEVLRNIQEAADGCVAARVAQGMPAVIIGTQDYFAALNNMCEYTVEIKD